MDGGLLPTRKKKKLWAFDVHKQNPDLLFGPLSLLYCVWFPVCLAGQVFSGVFYEGCYDGCYDHDSTYDIC